MLYAQLSGARSLREVEAGMASQRARLHHAGARRECPVFCVTGIWSTDMRRRQRFLEPVSQPLATMNTLALQVQEGLGCDPNAGEIFCFRGRKGDLVKILWPDSKAIHYMFEKDGRWQAFTAFLDDGRICLTNDAAERALRGVALGRKSWLFAGSERAGGAGRRHV